MLGSFPAVSAKCLGFTILTLSGGLVINVDYGVELAQIYGTVSHVAAFLIDVVADLLNSRLQKHTGGGQIRQEPWEGRRRLERRVHSHRRS